MTPHVASLLEALAAGALERLPSAQLVVRRAYLPPPDNLLVCLLIASDGAPVPIYRFLSRRVNHINHARCLTAGGERPTPRGPCARRRAPRARPSCRPE